MFLYKEAVIGVSITNWFLVINPNGDIMITSAD